MDIKHVLSQLQEAGLTQAQIALAIGCTQPTISDLSTGKIGQSRPSYKIVDGLQKARQKKHGISTAPQKQNRDHDTSIAEAEAKRNGGIRMHGDHHDRDNISK
ncbi:hypothetical protein ACFS07_10270 [Undibacterium arcticum]